jgi:hypothetical protein
LCLGLFIERITLETSDDGGIQKCIGIFRKNEVCKLP